MTDDRLILRLMQRGAKRLAERYREDGQGARAEIADIVAEAVRETLENESDQERKSN
ncbi:hypothetical protein [Notoacmeibacter sp. MSK16QG-6]|uniref:hypothetical protein n=1 Tax=Notoacmeibacter sp. MSK16QG-6 TaxID=2957982 RepID=UPI0020A0A898|nr:hypothetical protein [Notoacmeibacter sp. MSK16QG-6]MCP1200093.1 hypothetical protein [Notoacmeibacter sp. MSK16QG-6]